MPNINFDVANSFYNFVCAIGISIIALPHLYVFILKNESMYDTYIALNDRFGICFWTIYAFIEIVGIITLCKGLRAWYKNNQLYFDLKQKNETERIIAASEEEKKSKEQQEINRYIKDNSLSQKDILTHKNKIKEQYEKCVDAFYKYISEKMGGDFEIYREVKIGNYKMESINVCDIVLKSKYNKGYILYEIKIGKFSPITANKMKNKFFDLLKLFPFNQFASCRAEIVYIVDDEREKNYIMKYYECNKQYYVEDYNDYNDDSAKHISIVLKAYLIDEISQ